jgi:type II secretory pathway pseudopilin PulG
MKSEKGAMIIEAIVALALLGIIGASFLGSIGTASRATMVAEDKVIAESLTRGQIEYIKACPYAAEYPINPALDIPDGWSMPVPTVENIHGTDDGIQKVTITVLHGEETVLTTFTYKVDR